MATALDHMADDMAFVLADTGEAGASVNIDGTPDINVIRQPVDMSQYPPMPGILVERDQFWILQSDLGYVPEIGQRMTVDGQVWEVESVGKWPVVLLLLLSRHYS